MGMRSGRQAVPCRVDDGGKEER